VPRGAQVGHDSQTRNSFYHVHWYANPILTWLEVLLDFPCLEKGSLDLAYLTEVDPLWADDELTAILNPEAVLFANVVAKAACAADCVAASAGMPIASLFWCAGCQGSIYPMTGHVTTHIGGVQASVLLTQRMTAKMHRQLTTFTGAGSQVCAATTRCRSWTRPTTSCRWSIRCRPPPRRAASAASRTAAPP
jgi:conjugal transfer pilus assembly protein TraU